MLITVLTNKQNIIINKLKAVTPPSFLGNIPPGIGQEVRLLGMIGMAMNDINNAHPRQSLNFETFPSLHYDFLILATNMYILAFEQARYSLADVSYSENGYSINMDRTSKIGTSFETFKKLYETQLWGFKGGVLLDQMFVGLGTPRFQSNLSRFISMLGSGSAYGWNLP